MLINTKNILILPFLLIFSISQVIAQNNRTNINVEPDLILSLDDKGIFSPTLMAMDEEENIGIYDYGVHQLFFYNVADQMLEAHGEGLGGGPKEFRNPTSLSYDSYNRQFWLNDPQQARISIWKPDGKLVETLSIVNASSIATKVLPVSEKYYVWQPKTYRENGFELAISDHHMRIKKRMGINKLNPLKARFLKDGSVTADSTGIYYAGYNSDFIKKFSSNGKLDFQIRSIENIPNPEVTTEVLDVGGMEDVRVTKLSDETIIAALDIEVYKDELFVLFSGNKWGIAKKIDVYNKHNGQYLHSYIVSNQNLKKIEVHDGKVFAISSKEGKNNLVEFNL